MFRKRLNTNNKVAAFTGFILVMFLSLGIGSALPEFMENEKYTTVATADAGSTAVSQESLDSMLSAVKWLLLIVLILVFNIVMLVMKIREIKILPNLKEDLLNARLMLAFVILGIGGSVIMSFLYRDNLLPVLASVHGADLDDMFWTTMVITVLVTVVTNILLFYFAFKYRSGEKRKARFYPHNDRLEMIWTVIPAIVLIILIVSGIKSWHAVMSDPPKDRIEVELNAKQFAWVPRYPGLDNTFGKTHMRFMGAENELGFDFADNKGHDDVLPNEIHLPVNKAVLLKIKARDVLHAVYMPHFRVKMDAVPGMPTRFWFIPNVTTEEMRKRTNNPNFNYELACAEVCGRGHFSMRKVIVVETEEQYNAWLKSQKPYYIPAVTSTGSAEKSPADSTQKAI